MPAAVRRYLAAYGPASVADAQAWCGLTGLRAVFDALRPQLVTFWSESGTELFDLPGAPRPPGDRPAPVRLLPQFDNILLSHAERARMFDPAHRRLIYTENGIIHACVLVDGFVRATWKMRSTARAAVLEVSSLPGPSLDAGEVAAIEAEARRLLALAAPGSGHDVRVGEVQHG